MRYITENRPARLDFDEEAEQRIRPSLGLRECETNDAETFGAEFPAVTRRTVKILDCSGDPPDRMALIDGIVTGVELTSAHTATAEDIVEEVLRLVKQKHESYKPRGIFNNGPVLLLFRLSSQIRGSRDGLAEDDPVRRPKLFTIAEWRLKAIEMRRRTFAHDRRTLLGLIMLHARHPANDLIRNAHLGHRDAKQHFAISGDRLCKPESR
jgi:hypothetical protein